MRLPKWLQELADNPVVVRDLRLRRGRRRLMGLPIVNAGLWLLATVLAIISEAVYPNWAVSQGSGSFPMRPGTEWLVISTIAIAVIVLLEMAYFLPARMAGSIAREREMRTLDFVLQTPMTAKEVFIAKWLAGVAPLAISVLLLLPLCLLGWIVGPEFALIELAVWVLLGIVLGLLSLIQTCISARCARTVTATVACYLVSILALPNPCCSCGGLTFLPIFYMATVVSLPGGWQRALAAGLIALALIIAATIALVRSALRRLTPYEDEAK